MREGPRAPEASARGDFINVDRAGAAFLILVTAGAMVLTALGIHGSSIGMLARYAAPEAYARPLLGQGKEIRMDEWAHFTPALLYQLRRGDGLAYGNSVFGPKNAALLANLPTRHWSTVFRPQFWGFFALPDRYAFAAWWQFKNWCLLAGVFLLLKVFVRSSGLAIFGSLWFYFSSFTQWWFSSPTAMPEMVGLLGFVVTGICYLLVGRHWLRLAVVGVLAGGCFVNFTLCLYPSFLIPLALVGIALIAAFAVARWAQIATREFLVRRVVAAGICALVAAGALVFFFGDIREALGILRQTVYPGLRVVGGGEVSLAELASHAFNPWESAATVFPSSLVNVCEAAGFLWLAPIAIVLAIIDRRVRSTGFSLFAGSLKAVLRADGDRDGNMCRITFLATSLLFCLLLGWMLLPHSAGLDAALLFNHVSSHRAIIALGLLNICLTLFYLHSCVPPGRWRSGGELLRLGLVFGVAFAFIAPALFLTNARLRPEAAPGGQFLPASRVVLAAAFFSALAALLITRHRGAFAALTLLSLILANGLINPIDRGLGAVDRSALHQLAKSPDILRGKWLVFSPSVAAAPFFSANGFDVFNCARFIPDLDAMHVLDPERRYETVYNQSGYLLAAPLPAGGAAVFRHPAFFINECAVDPLDPRLGSLGIRFEAFDVHLDARLIPESSLHRLVEHSVDGFWLYEISGKALP